MEALSNMEVDSRKPDGLFHNLSVLLELAASDDLSGFTSAIDEEGRSVDEAGLWYGRRIGFKNMGLEERTPLMIASMFGSLQVLNYILKTGHVDVNRASRSDGATALHCAVAGGSSSFPDVIKFLFDASADSSSIDFNGSQPVDLVGIALGSPSSNSRRKWLETILRGNGSTAELYACPDQTVNKTGDQKQHIQKLHASKDGMEKKEYPIDLSLPDINDGIYGMDEFRMYAFKVKPCSRAYSHDWTECPFVHPGENARRRDPCKYHYSCVPCPEFRKGSCWQGDACEYAHGIFECWLHPAQYRTRLCKDETGCSRRVCFFAHKREELRPVCPSTGSALLSSRSFSANASSLEVGSMSTLYLGSSAQPATPTRASSPMAGGAMWPTQANMVPPALQLSSSRLRSTLSARDMELDVKALGLESHCRRQELIAEITGLLSPSQRRSSMPSTGAFSMSSGESNRFGGMKPTNLEDIFGSLDPSVLPGSLQLQSPTGNQLRQNMLQQHQSSYLTGLPSSPSQLSSFGVDTSRAVAAPASIHGLKSAAFAKRSQSFITRSAMNSHSRLSSATSSSSTTPSNLSDWGSPDGRLDWGMQGEELSKLRKSASFGFRSTPDHSLATDEPNDASWVQSGRLKYEEPQQQQYYLNNWDSEMLSPWLEQLYKEQEQMA